MLKSKSIVMRVMAFVCSLALLIVSIRGVSNAFASNNKDSKVAVSESGALDTGLSPVINPETNEEMYVVKSTFYDYYSDSQVGSGATPNAIDDGVYGTDNRATQNSFTKFNNVLLKTKNYGNQGETAAKYPLYLGLFYSNQPSYDNGGFYYNDSNEANDAKNFYLAANSSQQGGGQEGAVTNINTATQGLVDSKLSENGDITQTNNNKTDILPYFDKEYLTTTKFDNSSLSLGDVKENVSFPFRTYDNKGVTYYKFDSQADTVRFNGNDQLDYLGQNKSQVYDQKKENGVGVKPGFFPYNNSSDSDSTRLNYGFGVKLEIPFNMTVDGKVNGQDIVFEFSGDDDVWVFIDGQLALDIGGAHSRVEGTINFAEGVSTVSGVKNNIVAFAQRNWWFLENRNYSNSDSGLNGVVPAGQSVPGIFTNHKTEFSSALKESLKDTSSTHVLTMYYMERGKVESNMMVNFNLPEPNQLKVTNTIDYSDVNASLVDETKAVASEDVFTYDVIDKDLQTENNPVLKDGEEVAYVSKFADNDTLKVAETGLEDENRAIDEYYNTKWQLTDMYNTIAVSSDRDNYVVSDGRVEEKDAFLFANASGENAPKLQVDYTNKVLVNTLEIEKTLNNNGMTEDYSAQEYSFKVQLDDIFGKTSDEIVYDGTYEVYEGDTLVETATAADGIVEIKANQKAVIKGVPVGTKYVIDEQAVDGFYLESVVSSNENNTINDSKVEGSIVYGADGNNIVSYVNAVVTPEPTPEPTVEPTEEPTPEPTVEPTEEPTPEPTVEPTEEPTPEPTVEPTIEPTPEPTVEPTIEPTPEPTEAPVEVEVKAEVDDSPKTSDESKTVFWFITMMLSALLVVFTGYKLVTFRKIERVQY